jgi:hypothetical protein
MCHDPVKAATASRVNLSTPSSHAWQTLDHLLDGLVVYSEAKTQPPSA